MAEPYLVFMTSAIVFLILVLILILEIRMNKISRKLDHIAKDASEFLRLGLSHFKTKKK
ncbi:MAG: hypothetical protein GXO71_07700 [Caldiserica bacterium]|nr:hypothetical protein [Caldisericota bacterium]